MSVQDTRDAIDHVLRGSGFGRLSDAFASLFYGFNQGSMGNPIPYNTENHGLTFFVRPRLNLTYDNLAMVRRMMPLAASAPTTIQAIIRAYLDPVGNAQRINNASDQSTPLVDQNCAFIPLLTNTLISLNGWPDKTVGSHVSRPGVYRETWSMVDDISDYYGDFELTANFRNVKGDPITHLFSYWVDYESYVYTGRMMPWPDSVVENEIDYVTRIYRITLDETKQYVQKIGATGYCYPTASPIGASMNVNNDQPLNMDVAQQVSIPFKCHGFLWNDPLLIYTFNRTVSMFNHHMRTENLRSSNSLMVRLNPWERDLLRGYVYPRIDPRTNEMQWYATRSDYDREIGRILPESITLPSLGEGLDIKLPPPRYKENI